MLLEPLKHQIMSGFLTNDLQVASYELRVTSYYLLRELRGFFYMRVTSYYLLHELRVTFYIRVTSYCLMHELRVNF